MEEYQVASNTVKSTKRRLRNERLQEEMAKYGTEAPRRDPLSILANEYASEPEEPKPVTTAAFRYSFAERFEIAMAILEPPSPTYQHVQWQAGLIDQMASLCIREDQPWRRNPTKRKAAEYNPHAPGTSAA